MGGLQNTSPDIEVINQVTAIGLESEKQPDGSSTANLAGGATFTGAAFSTDNRSQLAVQVFADQITKLTIEQSGDGGTTWDTVETYFAPARPPQRCD
jgi:hypothetical protein